MQYNQKTVARNIALSGIGVHSGRRANLTICPAPPNHGIKFLRTDLRHPPAIPALFKMVADTSSATVLGQEGAIVSTVEHLLACLAGFGIDNALVKIDAYEVPIMDGSARPFAEQIAAAGTQVQDTPRCFMIIKEPLMIEEGDKFVGIYPDTDFSISYTIDYDHPLIGRQSYCFYAKETDFVEQISGARTFGFYRDYEWLKQMGLARGGALENTVVLDQDGILNPEGLRYQNEFIRHKILDCLGDFSLLGLPLLGRIVAQKSGHLFNHQLLDKLFRHKDCWETGLLQDKADAAAPLKELAF